MLCADACHLIGQGVVPGSADTERATLGFHLAACSSCREYRAQHETHALLQAMLAQPMLAAPAPIASLATAQTRLVQPAKPRYRRSLGAAVLVAGVAATLPFSLSAPARATTIEQPVPALAALPRPVHVSFPSANELLARLLIERPIESKASDTFIDDSDLLQALHDTRSHTAVLHVSRPIVSAAADWTVFAPDSSVDIARSQLAAFEQAGPQALPPQALDSLIDSTLASLPLEVGQTLFLPEQPPVPEPPPAVVAVPASTLPPLPAAPSQPAPPAPATPSKVQAAPVAQTRQYVVQAGDTLAKIALRFYDSEARWPEIYRANRGVVGSNPNLIRPSQQLVIPRLNTGGTNQPNTTPAHQGVYAVKSGDTLTAIALRSYGDASLWPLIYSANRGVIGGNPDFILPQQQLAIPSRSQQSSAAQPTTGQPTKVVAKPGAVKATGRLSYVVARGDSLRGLAVRVYGDERRWQEIYRANRAAIPDPDRLKIGITLLIP